VPLRPSTGSPSAGVEERERPSSPTAKLETVLSPPLVVNNKRRSGERMTLPAPRRRLAALLAAGRLERAGAFAAGRDAVDPLRSRRWRRGVVDNGIAELVGLHVEMPTALVAVHCVGCCIWCIVCMDCSSGMAVSPILSVRWTGLGARRRGQKPVSPAAAAMTPGDARKPRALPRATASVCSSGCPSKRWSLVYEVP